MAPVMDGWVILESQAMPCSPHLLAKKLSLSTSEKGLTLVPGHSLNNSQLQVIPFGQELDFAPPAPGTTFTELCRVFWQTSLSACICSRYADRPQPRVPATRPLNAGVAHAGTFFVVWLRGITGAEVPERPASHHPQAG